MESAMLQQSKEISLHREKRDFLVEYVLYPYGTITWSRQCETDISREIYVENSATTNIPVAAVALVTSTFLHSATPVHWSAGTSTHNNFLFLWCDSFLRKFSLDSVSVFSNKKWLSIVTRGLAFLRYLLQKFYSMHSLKRSQNHIFMNLIDPTITQI